MGFLRTVLILLGLWLVIRWVRGWLLPESKVRPRRSESAADDAENLANLTDQEISDADFEEIKEEPRD